MSKRINVVLRDDTLAVLRRLAPRGERSQFIDRAVRRYSETQVRRSLRERLKVGYRGNAARDLELASEWLPLEEESWQISESSRNPKKRNKTKAT